MKKISLFFFSIIIILIGLPLSASAFSDGVEYQTLNRPVTSEQQVIEFFSFYCPHCYQFEHIYHIPQAIEKVLPEGKKVMKYHVEFLGPLGKELTQAWAVAIMLNVENKISPMMFDAVQKTQTVANSDDIRNIFIEAGVSKKDYDAALNSFIVKSLVVQQVEMAKSFKLRGVPAVFVNDKYMIKSENFDINSMDTYADQYANLISFLINKK